VPTPRDFGDGRFNNRVKRFVKNSVRGAYRLLVPASVRSTLRLWLLARWPDQKPVEMTQFGPEPVLILAPHMDDEVIGCGGSARRHIEAKARVDVVFMTDGRFGGWDPDGTLVERRKDESRRAAQLVGFSDLIFLDAPDLGLTDSAALVKRLAELLRKYKPAIVYLPALTDAHIDHWATNRILRGALNCLTPMERPPSIRGYEVWSPLPANRLVDISAQADLKRQAIDLFESQVKIDDYANAVLGLNRYRSMTFHHGRGYCEAFLEMTPDEFFELYAAAQARSAGGDAT
jgi:LmbE family N-acetylglucosaminyl deacetylase